jgi:hypothetical protein
MNQLFIGSRVVLSVIYTACTLALVRLTYLICLANHGRCQGKPYSARECRCSEARIETTQLESNKTYLGNVLVSSPSYSTNGLLYETN